MLNIEELREYAIGKDDVEESFPFGNETLVFKIDNKIFLLVSVESEPLQFNVKCDPMEAIELREQYECVQPGYHMNKKHWNTVVVEGSLTKKQLLAMVDASYGLVANKKRKQQ